MNVHELVLAVHRALQAVDEPQGEISSADARALMNATSRWAYPCRWERLTAIALLVVGLGICPRATQACVGDCKDRGTVDIADLVTGVDIALGSLPVSACPAFANQAGAVDIAQLIQGVNNALNGCADRRFVDNGDGTISDKQTGLVWEKKVGIGGGVDAGNLHAADNVYFWAGECALEGNLCQPNEAAAAACRQGAQGDQSGCATCGPGDLGLDNSCRVDPNGETTTIWDWATQLNTANFAGHADWRVPTVAELESIVDYTKEHPAVDGAFNGTDCGAMCTDLTSAACSCTQSENRVGLYWSASDSSASVSEPNPSPEWWYVEFSGGGAGYYPIFGINIDIYVRAVRGGFSTPAPRFLDNGDGTITDKKTGLIWEKKVGFGDGVQPGNLHTADNFYSWAGVCSAATDTFCQPNAAAAAACMHGAQGDQIGCSTCQAVQGTCDVAPNADGSVTTIWDWVAQFNAANFAGHADWRVPTEAELESIVDYTMAAPALDSMFGEPPCKPHGLPCHGDWSASTFSDCSGAAWTVGFGDGAVSGADQCGGWNVRAVRGGS